VVGSKARRFPRRTSRNPQQDQEIPLGLPRRRGSIHPTNRDHPPGPTLTPQPYLSPKSQQGMRRSRVYNPSGITPSQPGTKFSAGVNHQPPTAGSSPAQGFSPPTQGLPQAGATKETGRVRGPARARATSKIRTNPGTRGNRVARGGHASYYSPSTDNQVIPGRSGVYQLPGGPERAAGSAAPVGRGITTLLVNPSCVLVGGRGT